MSLFAQKLELVDWDPDFTLSDHSMYRVVYRCVYMYVHIHVTVCAKACADGVGPRLYSV